MSGKVRSFLANGSVYDIPEQDVNDFLKDFNNAQEIRSFTVAKDTFDIPINDVNEFLKDYPNAKQLRDYSTQNTKKPEPTILTGEKLRQASQKAEPLNEVNAAWGMGAITPKDREEAKPQPKDLLSEQQKQLALETIQKQKENISNQMDVKPFSENRAVDWMLKNIPNATLASVGGVPYQIASMAGLIPKEIVQTSKDKDYSQALDNLRRAEKLLKTDSKEGVKAFSQGLVNPMFADIATAGLKEVGESINKAGIVHKINKGEPLTDHEQALLDTQGFLNLIQSGTNLPMSAEVGSAITQMIPYLVQFGATSGANTATKGLVNELLKTAESKGLSKILKETGSYVAGAAAQTPLMPMFPQNIADYNTGQIGFNPETGRGEITKEGYDIPKSVVKGFINTWAEVAGENLGEVAAEGVTKWGKKLASNPASVSKFQNGMFKAAETVFGESGSKLPSFSKLVPEMLEEEATGVVQSANDNDWSFFTLKPQLTTLFSIMGMSAASRGLNVKDDIQRTNINEKMLGAEHKLNRLPENVQHAVRMLNYDSNPETVAKGLSEMWTKGLIKEEDKPVILDYVKAAARKNAYDGLVEGKNISEVLTQNMHKNMDEQFGPYVNQKSGKVQQAILNSPQGDAPVFVVDDTDEKLSIVRSQDGTTQMVPKADIRVTNEFDYNEFKNAQVQTAFDELFNQEQTQKQDQQQAEQSNQQAKESSQQVIGQQLEYQGKPYVISYSDADGVLLSELDNEGFLKDTPLVNLSIDEVNNLLGNEIQTEQTKNEPKAFTVNLGDQQLEAVQTDNGFILNHETTNKKEADKIAKQLNDKYEGKFTAEVNGEVVDPNNPLSDVNYTIHLRPYEQNIQGQQIQENQPEQNQGQETGQTRIQQKEVQNTTEQESQPVEFTQEDYNKMSSLFETLKQKDLPPQQRQAAEEEYNFLDEKYKAHQEVLKQKEEENNRGYQEQINQARTKLKEQGFKSEPELMNDSQVEYYQDKTPESMAMDIIQNLETKNSDYTASDFPKAFRNSGQLAVVQENIKQHLETGVPLLTDAKEAIKYFDNGIKNRQIEHKQGKFDTDNLEIEVVTNELKQNAGKLRNAVDQLFGDKLPDDPEKISNFINKLTYEDVFKLNNYGKETNQGTESNAGNPNASSANEAGKPESGGLSTEQRPKAGATKGNQVTIRYYDGTVHTGEIIDQTPDKIKVKSNGIVYSVDRNRILSDKQIEEYNKSINEDLSQKSTKKATETIPESIQNQQNKEDYTPNGINKSDKNELLLEKRKQRILTEGTGFDKTFSLIPVKDIKTTDDVLSNIDIILKTLKENEGNGKYKSFEGFAYGNKYSKNGGEQIREYLIALDVLPKELLHSFYKNINVKNYEDISKWAEKRYQQPSPKQGKADTGENKVTGVSKPKTVVNEKQFTPEQIHNQLVFKLRELNGIPKNHTTKRDNVNKDIHTLVRKLGYKLDLNPDGTTWASKDGKPIRRIARRTPQAELNNHKSLSDYPQEFINFVTKLFDNTGFLHGIDVGYSFKELQPVIDAIRNGKKGEASNTVLDRLESFHNNGIVSFKATKNSPAFSLTVDELLKEIDRIDEQVDDLPDWVLNTDWTDVNNWDIPLEKDEISIEEHQNILNELENEQETNPPAEEKRPDVPLAETTGTTQEGKEPKEIAALKEQIVSLRTQLRETITSKNKAINEANSRNGLFGDTKQTAPSLFEDIFKVDQQAIDRIKKPFDDKIASIKREIESLQKTIETGKKEISGQQEIKAEEKKVDTNPTEEQKQAGNYKMGHVTVQGFDVTIENPKGSIRSGIDSDGERWETKMNNTYGYFKRTKGKDGDQIDVFLGDNLNSDKVFVIDQVDPKTGAFDESKVMLGFNSINEAKSNYLKNYSPGWKGLGTITESPINVFKKWLNDGTRQNKAYSEYKSVEQNSTVTEKTTTESKTNQENIQKKQKPIVYKSEENRIFEKEEINKAYGNAGLLQRATSNTVQDTRNSNANFYRGTDLSRIKKRTVIDGFEESGKSDVIGIEINGASDIADIWSIHRSPYIEKAHVIFLNEGKIVGTTATTLNKPDQTMFLKPSEIIELCKKFDSKEVYYLHNHPSGNHTVSSNDVSVTNAHKKELEKNGINLIGHVVIDHEKFSLIDLNSNPIDGYSPEAYARLKVKSFDYKNAVPRLFSEREQLPPGEGAPVRMMEIARALLNSKKYKGAIVYLSPNLSITAYDVLPKDSNLKSISEMVNGGLKNNLGALSIIIHNGQFNFSNEVLNNRVIDVINTKLQQSDYFGRKAPEKPEENELIKLWENKYKYANLSFRKTDPIETIQELQDKAEFATPIKFVDTADDLPNWIKKNKNFDNTVEAVNAGSVVYFIKDKIKNRDHAIILWIHEVGQHGGIRNLIPTKELRNEFFNHVWNSAKELAKTDAKIKAIVDSVTKGYGEESRGNEFLAYFAETIVNEKDLTRVQRNFWLNILDKFNEILKKVFNFSDNNLLSQKDLHNIIIASIQSNYHDQKKDKSTSFVNTFRKEEEKRGSDMLLQDGALRVYPKTQEGLPGFRKSDPENFYSTVENSFNNITQEKATPEQWKAQLEKNGAKQAELDWMGWDDFVKSQSIDGLIRKTIDKEAVQGWIDLNKIEVREVKNGDMLPVNLTAKKSDSGFYRVYNNGEYYNTVGQNEDVHSEQDAIDYVKDVWFNNKNEFEKTKYSQYQLPGGENYKELLLTMPFGKDTWEEYKNASSGKTFKSSHFDEPNILAHVRFNDRTDTNGNKVLFLEEIQSDASQAIRKGTTDFKSPFTQTPQWVNLVLRRALKYAADNGYDRVAWTPGEVQAERYDLSKQVDKILYRKDGEDNYYVNIKLPNNQLIAKQNQTENDLENLVGKEVASKIVNGEKEGTLSGLDLKVGGEGMIDFYNKIVPAQAKKVGKPFGANVEQTEIPLAKNTYEKAGDNSINMETGEVEPGVKDNGKTLKVLSLPVNDNMRESMPLFRKEDSPVTQQAKTEESLNKNELLYRKSEKAPESVNSDVLESMKRSHGLKEETLSEKLTRWANEIRQTTRHFKYLTEKENPVVYNQLRLFESVPEASRKEAFDKLEQIIKPIANDKNLYEGFERYIVIKDLLSDIDSGLYKGKELPWGYKNEDEVREDVKNMDGYVKNNPALKNTIANRNALMYILRDKLIEAGLLPEKTKEKENYFHHQVLAYREEQQKQNISEWSRDARLREKGFQKSRVGSMKAYNTDYLQSEFEVMAQSLESLAVKGVLNNISKSANIMPALVQQAKEKGGKWQDYVPEGYTRWYPKKGTNAYKAATITEKAIQNILDGQDTTDIDKLVAESDNMVWVIPDNVARQLDEMKTPSREILPVRGMRKLNNFWKQWTLISPPRVLKYNINNMSGDLDIVMAYDPKILLPKYAHAAMVELASARKKGMSQDVKEALRNGVITSGLSIQEIPDINNSGVFKSLTGRDNLLHIYWKSVQDATQFRENMLRVAAYKYFKDQIEQGKKVYGASKPESIDAIKDSSEKAGKLARELIGDYGNISQGGAWLRSHIFPFWSWVEVNTPRYYRLFANLAEEEKGLSRGAGMVASKTAFGAIKLSAKMLLLSGLTTLWNRLFFPDEDDELTKAGVRQLRLILGRRDDGSIISLRVQGALSDVLSFVGLEDGYQDYKDVKEKKSTIGKKSEEGLNAFVNKFAQGLMPIERTGYELMTGKSLYPDIFEPRPIRDRYEHALRAVQLNKIYDVMAKKPTRGWKEFSGLILYENDPGEASYYLMRQKIYDFLDTKEIDRPSGEPTKRSNALYYYKKAIKLKDNDVAKYWWDKYMSLGGSEKGMEQSITRGEVLSPLPKDLKDEFLKTLDGEDQEVLKIAENWYKKTYNITNEKTKTVKPGTIKTGAVKVYKPK